MAQQGSWLGLYYGVEEGVCADAFGHIKAEAITNLGLPGVGAADATKPQSSPVDERVV